MADKDAARPDLELFASHYFAAMVDVLGVRDQLRRIRAAHISEEDFNRDAELMRDHVQKIHSTRLTLKKMCEMVRTANAEISRTIPPFDMPEPHVYGFTDRLCSTIHSVHQANVKDL
jgi:hypothetical protein